MTDQLIPVDRDVIRELKHQLGGESILDFVKPEFAELALGVYEMLGSPPVSSASVWHVFSHMLPSIYEALAKLEADEASEMLSDCTPPTHQPMPLDPWMNNEANSA